jgi:hypothetical protein
VQLDDCYRLLEVDPSATEEEVKAAYRDLTKVWHPDRFAHDPELQRKAQEKLKAINEAYDAIRGVAPVRPARPFRAYAIACAVGGVAILLRRPTPTGLLVAAVLFMAAIYLMRLR